MIREPSEHIKKASKKVKILRMQTDEHEIMELDYRITIADVANSTGGYYRVVLSEEPSKIRSVATCNCQGFLFSGNCKHIYAVFVASREETI